MSDVKDHKSAISTDTPPGHCGQCAEPIPERAKFCPMCAWKVPVPPPPSLEEILEADIRVPYLIYDAKSMAKTHWKTTVGAAGHHVVDAKTRAGSYLINVRNLVTPQWDLMPTTANCYEMPWMPDCGPAGATWEMLADRGAWSSGADPYNLIRRGDNWHAVTMPILHMAGVTHMCRNLGVPQGSTGRMPVSVKDLLAAMVEGPHKEWTQPRCGHTFEVISSIPWAKLNDWYGGVHPKQHELKAADALNISFSVCDAAYYKNRAGVLYDLDRAAVRVGAMTPDQLATHLANSTAGIAAAHAEYNRAQAEIDKYLNQLPEKVYYVEHSGEWRFVGADAMTEFIHIVAFEGAVRTQAIEAEIAKIITENTISTTTIVNTHVYKMSRVVTTMADCLEKKIKIREMVDAVPSTKKKFRQLFSDDTASSSGASAPDVSAPGGK